MSDLDLGFRQAAAMEEKRRDARLSGNKELQDGIATPPPTNVRTAPDPKPDAVPIFWSCL